MSKISLKERLIRFMADGKWHSYKALHKVGGFRYSARLLELKQLGWKFQDRPLKDGGKEYRLWP